jgi:hypothetical protein
VAVAANVTANLRFPAVLDILPVLGIAIWIVILATALGACRSVPLEAPPTKVARKWQNEPKFNLK